MHFAILYGMFSIDRNLVFVEFFWQNKADLIHNLWLQVLMSKILCNQPPCVQCTLVRVKCRCVLVSRVSKGYSQLATCPLFILSIRRYKKAVAKTKGRFGLPRCALCLNRATCLPSNTSSNWPMLQIRGRFTAFDEVNLLNNNKNTIEDVDKLALSVSHVLTRLAGRHYASVP